MQIKHNAWDMRLQKKLEKIWINIKKEVSSHYVTYSLLFVVLAVSLFVRTYRLQDLLGFYYDQGRDALVIWRLWHEGKLFLIGPVTGLHGIFLGPFYYYLIAPFYILGGGNPVYPAAFLAFTTVLALVVLFIAGSRMFSRTIGLIAVIMGGLSYYLVLAGRWLSNPTPIFLTSVLLLWVMWEIINSKFKIKSEKYKIQNTKLNFLWLVVALLIGLSLQFESASAVFYLPIVLAFAIWQKKKLPAKKTMIVAAIIFFLTLLPQVVFDFRHDNIISNNLKRELLIEKSFRNPISIENFEVKLNYFWTVFSSKIFPKTIPFYWIIYVASVLGIFKLFPLYRKQLILLFIFLGTPIAGITLFQGNSGNIFDYYMTGYYLPLILLFSAGIGAFTEFIAGRVIIGMFLLVFLNINGNLINNYLTSPIGGPDGVALGNELQAVSWIFDNAEKNKADEFNVDVYVPPVIPHSYDYLFLWQGTKRCGVNLCGFVRDRQVNDLYTLYEEDPPHPERSKSWLDRQNGIGRVLESERYAKITVEKRERN